MLIFQFGNVNFGNDNFGNVHFGNDNFGNVLNDTLWNGPSRPSCGSDRLLTWSQVMVVCMKIAHTLNVVYRCYFRVYELLYHGCNILTNQIDL